MTHACIKDVALGKIQIRAMLVHACVEMLTGALILPIHATQETVNVAQKQQNVWETRIPAVQELVNVAQTQNALKPQILVCQAYANAAEQQRVLETQCASPMQMALANVSVGLNLNVLDFLIIVSIMYVSAVTT